MTAPRLAVFFAPSPSSELWRTGSAVLGRDAASGARVAFPDSPPCDAADWEDVTAEPRRYGFHATLAAPFELADGASEAETIDFARAFVADRVPFDLPDLAVADLADFVALRPSAPSTALERLAADCVVLFHPYRAPLSPEDRARRLGPDPSAERIANVDRWGYPHVFEHHRFHMTLTGSLADDRRAGVRAALAEQFGDALRGGVVDAITLFRQESRDAPFRVLARLPFGGRRRT
ncbi:MAG: DUF1045 domain-containing protein [Phyllobacteriaceae bacterium]|nr:DUF1045 domain-containing protein [Phyllobacteriaceae bacterium]